MLIGISTPYRRVGLLHQKHRDCFGKDDADVLVVQGATAVFNPTVDRAAIEAARRSDPHGAVSEWDAEFRSGLSAFMDDASIDGAIEHGRPLELPPRARVKYHAFVDMSGGRHDASCIAILHAEGEGDARRLVLDVVRGRRGDPSAATKEFADLVRQYGVSSITGDNYGADWVSAAFKAAGVGYVRSRLTRSELYLEGLPNFTRGLVSIPDHAGLVRELRLLERRTSRTGKDVIDHGVGGSDDHANSLFGAMWLAATPSGVVFAAPGIFVGGRCVSEPYAYRPSSSLQSAADETVLEFPPPPDYAGSRAKQICAERGWDLRALNGAQSAQLRRIIDNEQPAPKLVPAKARVPSPSERSAGEMLDAARRDAGVGVQDLSHRLPAGVGFRRFDVPDHW
jgi:hypothetical protein